ncbi:N(G),N(G)-dimethylarginine dimethylaminohydrolase 1 [Lunasporangiospora selenospora]|uniref:N(G),N(G)-dimethylarginine dimethylaminohydrolase 1 n=1 Tax=Lunasporangiospora selenospora TaxID=979761 RepID=A0A9P6FMH6_9FUNG|nr:N(G),N(G)-dimethylarginine dimethylaminohydrolase 1 [Lunasporangiospora selenospora]
MVHLRVPPYKQAFVRDLSNAFSQAALTSYDNSIQPIDMELAHHQHEQYVDAVRQFVPNVQTVAGSDNLADCCFIEDTCVIIHNVAVITRPGHPNRREEVVGVKQALEKYALARQEDEGRDVQDREFHIHPMPEPCLLDGGDVLFTGSDVFVGLSKRTNREGAEFLSKIFDAQYGLAPVHVIDLQNSASASTLHLKCVVSALVDTVLVVSDDDPGRFVQGEIQRLTQVEGQDSKYKFVQVPDQISSNILRFPNAEGGLRGMVVQKRFPKSTEVLKAAVQTIPGGEDCKVVEVDMSQFILADGALTCCSLLLA